MVSQIENFKTRRVVNLFLGLISIILSLIVYFTSSATHNLQIALISISLGSLGIARFLTALFDEDISESLKLTNLLMGMISFMFGFVGIIKFAIATEILIILITIGLFIFGIMRILNGFIRQLFSTWYRVLIIIIGIISIILGIFVIWILTESSSMLNVLSIGFLLNGLIRVLYGLIGKHIYKNKK